MMREDILAAALGIVRESGIRGLTMRALGQAVGVTAPTLYDYFASKEQVLDALFLEGTNRLQARFQEAFDTLPPGFDRLQAIGTAYRRFAYEDNEQFMLIFGRKDVNYVPGEAVRGSADKLFQMLVDAVTSAMEAGEIVEADPIAISVAAWAGIHGMVMLEINGFLDKCAPGDPEDLYAATSALLFGGFRKTNPASAPST
jgi:AcrR family transcriptional regulator